MPFHQRPEKRNPFIFSDPQHFDNMAPNATAYQSAATWGYSGIRLACMTRSHWTNTAVFQQSIDTNRSTKQFFLPTPSNPEIPPSNTRSRNVLHSLQPYGISALQIRPRHPMSWPKRIPFCLFGVTDPQLTFSETT